MVFFIFNLFSVLHLKKKKNYTSVQREKKRRSLLWYGHLGMSCKGQTVVRQSASKCKHEFCRPDPF